MRRSRETKFAGSRDRSSRSWSARKPLVADLHGSTVACGVTRRHKERSRVARRIPPCDHSRSSTGCTERDHSFMQANHTAFPPSRRPRRSGRNGKTATPTSTTCSTSAASTPARPIGPSSRRGDAERGGALRGGGRRRMAGAAERDALSRNSVRGAAKVIEAMRSTAPGTGRDAADPGPGPVARSVRLMLIYSYEYPCCQGVG